MIVRGGVAITIPVMFPAGPPDGAVAWKLYDAAGILLDAGAVVVPANAVSINLPVTAANNALGAALFGSRDIEWSYTVGGAVVNGDQRYNLEARPLFGVSADGVRTKLGVSSTDLPDDNISLIRAYVSFRDTVGADVLAAVTDAADLLSVRDAIEAQAALVLIPTMAVRVAAAEDSGTNSYKRQAIDWDAVSSALSTTYNAGILAVLPSYDPSPTGALFVLATPATDPITGGVYSSG